VPPAASDVAERRWDPWPDEPVPALVGPWRALDVIGLILVAAAGAVLRFLQRSPLWLDEALSVNIATPPDGGLVEALRHDGHPPLYYALLNAWMDVFGSGPVAVRSLSAVIGLALLPLAFVAAGRIAGRRAAWAAVLLVALNPFVLRYSTEARMYELVMVLALAGWLLVDHALDRPRPHLLAGLVVVTGALLWTHYWGLWLVGAAGLGLLGRGVLALRRGERNRGRASLAVVAALAVGCLTFTPWLPNLLHQAAHTGTPWAEPSLPTEVASMSLLDLGGGVAGESVLLAVLFAVFVAVGLLGRPTGPATVELDLRTRPEARRLSILVVATLGLATAVSWATGAAYASRYFSVVAPMVLVLIGVGVSRVRGAVAFRVVLVVLLLLGAMAGTRAALTRPRTQAGVVADAIVERADGGGGAPYVLVCPDQLGPALSRELPDDVVLVRYPDLEPGDLVDWDDYEERLAEASPAEVAERFLATAGDADAWLVWYGSYRTHQGTCEAVLTELQRARPAGHAVVTADTGAFEPSNAYLFPAT